MIGRVYAPGRSFKRLVSYLETGKDGLQRVRDRVEWMEFRNLPTRSPQTAVCFMAATASESVTGTETPVYHFSVSCDPGDAVDSETLRRVADRMVHDLGLEEHEALIFAHKDRAHPHLHFVVNRVHPERGTLWSNWWDYARIERSLRAQEQELGMRVVPGWHSPLPAGVERAQDGPGEEPAAERVVPRPGLKRGGAAFLRDVTERAAPVLERARTWSELESGLAGHGLSLRVQGGGFIVTDGTRQVKASEVGRAFSRFHLEKRLGRYPDYHARKAMADVAPRAALPAESQATTRQPESPTGQEDAPVRHGRRPQFGDAGHGINELFGYARPPDVAHPVTLQPERRKARSLKEVQELAGPVLERASSWAELESGLAEPGLSLREKGGGFVITDGDREVKASDVGRAFSRFHLERRLGGYPSSRARGAADEAPPAQLALPLPSAAIEPTGQPSSLPIETPAPARPSMPQEEPQSPSPPAVQMVEPAPVRPPEPPASVRKKTRPLTDREQSRDRYRAVLRAFRAELAALYRDPRAARRAFELSLADTSPDAAARALESNPERFGRLRWGADRRRGPEAAHWAELYARMQMEGTRLYARHAAARFQRAVAVEEAEAVLRDAKSAFHRVAERASFVADRARKANEAERNVERWLREIYDYPTQARERIEAYRNAHGREATVRALRESPEQFGELRAEKYRLLVLRDATDARWKAGGYANWLDGAFEMIATQPTREERASANEAVRVAQRKVDTAQSARDTLGPASASDSVRDGLQSLHAAERGRADRARRIDRQVTFMLPAGAVQVVRRLMRQFTQELERERAREPHRSVGPDIN